VVVGGNLGREGLGASSELLLITLSLLLVKGCDWVNICDVLVVVIVDVLLGSTPPFSVFDCLLESLSKSHSHSGYSESSLARTSGLLRK
jgi:hypothetical protein